MAANDQEQQLHIPCSNAVLDRRPMERIEKIYMIAFGSMNEAT
jgi:hypothetical protein